MGPPQAARVQRVRPAGSGPVQKVQRVKVGGFMDTPFGREGLEGSKGVRQFGVYSIVR